MSDGTFIVWTYHLSVPDADFQPSLDEAIFTFWCLRDSDQCAVDSIEVWDESGHRIIDHDEAYALGAERARRWKEEHPQPEPLPRVAWVWVRHHDSKKWSDYSSYADAEEAQRKHDELASVMGADRVTITDDNHRPYGDLP